MADLQLEGKFDQLKGKIRSAWGALTDNDIEEAKGNMEQLIGKIKERTGEREEDIRKRIEGFADSDSERSTTR